MAPPLASEGLPEPQALSSAAAFHELFEVPVVESGPRMPSEDRCELRVSLLQEELDELKDAIATGDLVESADALADLQYVLSGAVLEFGLHRRFKAVFDEVQRSNMSKACATLEEAEATVAHYKATMGVEAEIHGSAAAGGKFLVKRLPDGKVLKSVRYSPAQLRRFVEADSGTADEAPPLASEGVPEPQALSSVAAFHEMFEVPVVKSGPRMPSEDRCKLRVSLLQEELDELKDAIATGDLVESADALADLQYVLSGTVLEFGLHRRFKAVFDEVQRSNMSKACATLEEAEATVAHYKATKGVEAEIHESATAGGKFLVKRLPDGKVLKSVRYSPAQLRHFVEADSGTADQAPAPTTPNSKAKAPPVTPEKSTAFSSARARRYTNNTSNNNSNNSNNSNKNNNDNKNNNSNALAAVSDKPAFQTTSVSYCPLCGRH
ncbi:unnamed protein product [Polarella glacialis]|uniref:Uncharacterized protein n=1 Tax=Polarella glacialis TaxID=89957 RepID=A0A813L013_POLGL|nr:unnamed protein product [Polarella glacialis]